MGCMKVLTARGGRTQVLLMLLIWKSVTQIRLHRSVGLLYERI